MNRPDCRWCGEAGVGMKTKKRKIFRARWKLTGEECNAWRESKEVIGFARDGETPFRSLPTEDFWRWFEQTDILREVSA